MLALVVMPELKNEIPSQQELRLYFLEHCPWMAAPNEPEFSDDPLFLEAQSRYGCLDFRAKVGEVIWVALNELNALDRSHVLWTNTNRRPTIYKLPDFANSRLATHPEDRLALWTLAVLATFHGSNDFGSEYWKRLWKIGGLDIRWPIRAGLWHEMMLNFGGRLMADLIVDMAAQEAAWPTLEDMSHAHASEIRKWALEVMALVLENRRTS